MALSKANIIKAVKATFKALGDIPEACVYRRTTNLYDPSLGTNVTTNTNYNIEAIFVASADFKLDKSLVTTEDDVCILQQSEITFLPNPSTDKIVRANGQVFNVIFFTSDPVGATYKINLRAP